jgi:glutamine amidotransferase
MSRLAVIDHGAGNLVSIAQGLRRAGADVTVATGASHLADVDGIVLPGVGTTGAAMERLEAAGLTAPLREYPGPLLGICVGLQLFFDVSEEDDGGSCLGLIPGVVRRLQGAPLLPHIGWNDVAVAADPLFAGLGHDPAFYFVHSYAPQPQDESGVIGWTEYGSRFASAVRDGNRVGVQFHPERSGSAGLTVLANFVAACREADRAA